MTKRKEALPRRRTEGAHIECHARDQFTGGRPAVKFAVALA